MRWRDIRSLIGLASFVFGGCAPQITISQEIERGTPKVLERPVPESDAERVKLVLEGSNVLAQVVPRRCITTTQTPVKTTEITHTSGVEGKKAAVYYGLAALVGAASYAVFNTVPNRPEECPKPASGTEDKCLSKDGARAYGVVLGAFGVALAAGGTWNLISPTEHESKKELGTEMMQVESAPHACALEGDARLLELRMPGGQTVTATLDQKLRAVFALQEDWLAGLRSTASASVYWRGAAVGAVELAPAVKAHWRARGVEPGVVTTSSLVGASGSIGRGGARVEVSVSPQDGTGAFAGVGLGAESFSLSDVSMVPVGGGRALPLALTVERVETFAPKTEAASAVLLFDSSGSMRSNDPAMSGRIQAAQAFVDAIQGSVETAVLDFGVGGSDGLRASRILQSFTHDRLSLEKALQHLRSDGGTPLYEALGDSMTLLEREQRAGAIVLLTDGQAHGNHVPFIERAKASGVPIYAVGLGSNLDFRVLRDIGVETGGAFVDAADRDALAAAFRGVGTGVAIGQVRVRATGALSEAVPPGAYDVKGQVITTVPERALRVAHPFSFRTRVEQ